MTNSISIEDIDSEINSLEEEIIFIEHQIEEKNSWERKAVSAVKHKRRQIMSMQQQKKRAKAAQHNDTQQLEFSAFKQAVKQKVPHDLLVEIYAVCDAALRENNNA